MIINPFFRLLVFPIYPVENGDLTNTDNEELREDLTNIILMYQWNIGIKNYKLVQILESKE